MSGLDSAHADPEPTWKKLKLSFERPYKDDSGNKIPILYDLTPEGEHIYEPSETSTAKLEANLSRIFLERGADFFERRDELLSDNSLQKVTNHEVGEEDTSGDSDPAVKTMTVDELYAMRCEIMPSLFIALGEMSHARDLLNAVLSGTTTTTDPYSSLLSATIVTKPPSIISVRAFNAQLTIGSKDEALRKAAGLFKSAAESMERSGLRGEKYWVDALRIRRGNWSLTPAPLPYGSATGKGADKTSKDFIISYGLEGCSFVAPTFFRRRAIAVLPTFSDTSQDVVFPLRQNTRLKISISTTAKSWAKPCFFASPRPDINATNPETILKIVQTEVVDQEIFSLLVKEAGQLPTASARVSERLIVIDAAQGLDLLFELVDTSSKTQMNQSDGNGENMCELIYHVLHVLLLRRHNLARPEEGGVSNKAVEFPSTLLQPIIDILQYGVFCERVKVEMQRAVNALTAIGFPSSLSFTAVGESGPLLVSLLSDQGKRIVGGEAVLRVDYRRTLWFTFVSPSTLTAHLPQATLIISSLPQLTQLLMDEIERFLLQRISAIGRDLCSSLGSIWFIDMNRCVAKWEGCVLNFSISYGTDLRIGCSAFRLDATTSKDGNTQRYVEGNMPFTAWIKQIIQESSHVVSA